MKLPKVIANLPPKIIRFFRGTWEFVRWTNLLALGAGRFHTSWLQGIGAAFFCALWFSAAIGVYVLNGIFGLDYVQLGPLDWVDWLFLPIIAFLASHVCSIFIGRFMISKAKVAALLDANDLPSDSSIYDVDWRYGPMLWVFCYFCGVAGLLTLAGVLIAFLGVAPTNS